MRTNIEIDDKLMAQVMRLRAGKTKRAVVEEGLQTLVQIDRQERALQSLGSGKFKWIGNLDKMRRGE